MAIDSHRFRPDVSLDLAPPVPVLEPYGALVVRRRAPLVSIGRR